MIFLTIYDNNNYDSAKISLEYIAKVIKKENYQLDDLLIDFLNQQSNKLFINNLLYLYEKAEIKCFEYLTEQIDINEKDKNISTEKESKIKEYFSDSDLLLKEDIMINSIKKYILRYCIGSDIDNNNIFKNCDLEKLVNKEDIWSNKIYQDDKFKLKFEKLKKLNDEENNIMKYFFKTLFKVKTDKEKKEDKKEKDDKEKKDKKEIKEKKIKYNPYLYDLMFNENIVLTKEQFEDLKDYITLPYEDYLEGFKNHNFNGYTHIMQIPMNTQLLEPKPIVYDLTFEKLEYPDLTEKTKEKSKSLMGRAFGYFFGGK
jgi:hypothetical protein